MYRTSPRFECQESKCPTLLSGHWTRWRRILYYMLFWALLVLALVCMHFTWSIMPRTILYTRYYNSIDIQGIDFGFFFFRRRDRAKHHCPWLYRVWTFPSHWISIHSCRRLVFPSQAACDISETISCSKVLTSPYGRGFGWCCATVWLLKQLI